MTIPAIAAVLVAGMLVDHVQLSMAGWLQLIVSLALGSVPFAALGLLIGYLFDANSAQGAAMISLFSLAILGGLWCADLVLSRHVGYHRSHASLVRAGGSRPGRGSAGPRRTRRMSRSSRPTPWRIGGLVVWRYRASEQRASG